MIPLDPDDEPWESTVKDLQEPALRRNTWVAGRSVVLAGGGLWSLPAIVPEMLKAWPDLALFAETTMAEAGHPCYRESACRAVAQRLLMWNYDIAMGDAFSLMPSFVGFSVGFWTCSPEHMETLTTVVREILAEADLGIPEVGRSFAERVMRAAKSPN